MNKDKLRKNILKKRSKQSQDQHKSKSYTIANKILDDEDFKKAHRVLFYASFGSEVRTEFLIKLSLPQKLVYLPKVNLETKILEIYRIDKFEELEKGAYGILEPLTDYRKSIGDIDLVIVPGIVFDKKGYRLGYGKGYYDKLLKDFKKPKIGLAYDLQVVKKVPKEGHDIPVDRIITEKRVIDC